VSRSSCAEHATADFFNTGTQARQRRRFRLIAALLLALALGHALGLLRLPLLQRLDLALTDLRVRLSAPASVDPRIVVVEIDERALANQGHWPWRRTLLATLIDKLAGAGGARLVALDLVLAEPDGGANLAALDRLTQALPAALARQGALQAALQALRPALDDDALLAATVARWPVVLGFHLSNDAAATRLGALPPPWADDATLGGHAAAWTDWRGHGGNLAPLQRAARLGGGHLNAEIDADGLLRRVPLLARHDGGVQPALALAVARADMALPGNSTATSWQLVPATPPLRALRLRHGAQQLQVPAGADAMVLLPYRSSGAIQRLSADDVLADRLSAGALRDKLVLLGVSVPGLVDLHSTPVEAAMTGTLVQAHLLSGLLDGRLRVLPADSALIEATSLLTIGALLTALLPGLGLLRATALSALLLAALLAGHALAWSHTHWALPLAAPLVLLLALLLLHAVLRYQASSGARHHLQRLFGHYVPPELVAEMAREPERYSMRSRQAELSVLFADVRGFTSLAEHMPPDQLSAMMNLMFSHLTDTIRGHRGTLDKYIGDAVMAFWGAPLDDPDHARHAVEAALAMRAQLPALQAELRARGWPALDIAIGVDTGTMVVGDMGSRHRLAYTVLGDAVNRAARLQDLASKQRLGLVVGDATRRAMPTQCFLPLGEVALRGRDHALPAWLPLPQRVGDDAAVDARCAAWVQLLATDAAGHRPQAEQLLAALEAQTPGCPCSAWQRRRWAGAV
jgi:adenylate cyclase